MNLVSALCLCVASYCAWYNFDHGNDLVLIPAAIVVFVGLFTAVKAIRSKKGTAIGWILAIGNGLGVLLTILILFTIVVNKVF